MKTNGKKTPVYTHSTRNNRDMPTNRPKTTVILLCAKHCSHVNVSSNTVSRFLLSWRDRQTRISTNRRR